ncbi:hypothetical protein [Halorussus caseinilyticus]|uniref:Uncharacterized protein n=1 Tax=Halorussus caseinilyticus TaxID=3034025 RepID=A0ABD5WQS8_9EURY
MSGVTEIKPRMYTEDLSEEERREEYSLSEEDVAELRARMFGTADVEDE